MTKTKFDETFIFKISMKIWFFFMYILASKFRFLEFRLLLSQVAPYYSSLPRTVWKFESLSQVRFLKQ